MERRTFLSRLGQTLVAIPVLGIASSCGGDDAPTAPGNPNPSPVDSFDSTSSSNSGHTHTITFTCAGLNGGLVTYVSDGSHSHSITLTTDQVTRVLNGESVGPIVSSLSSGHTHNWTIQKPANACV